VFLVASAMIGSGLYLFPSSMALVGSISILGWICATLGAAFLGGVFSCLAILRPGGAGLFSYIADAFGPAAGFVTGMFYWCPVAIVPIAVGLTGYLAFFLPFVATGTAATITTVAIIWLFVGANIIGPRFIAQFGGISLIAGLAPIALITVFGALHFQPAVFAASWNVTGASPLIVVPQSTVTAFYAFIGVEVAAVIAPLLRNPSRNVPIATFGGLGIAAMTYILASALIMGVLPASVLAKSTAPFADAAIPLLGGSIAGLLAACTLLKVSGSFSSNMLAVVETADSPVLFGALVRKAGHSPAAGPSKANLLVVGVVMSFIVIFSANPNLARQFNTLANISVVLFMLVYLTACLSLLKFCRAAPARLKWFSRVAAIGGSVFCCAVIVASERDLLVWSVGAVAVAGLAWLVVGKRVTAARANGV
jgi:arginine:agmatine antiporter